MDPSARNGVDPCAEKALPGAAAADGGRAVARRHQRRPGVRSSGGVAGGRRGTRCGRACTCDPPRRKTCSGAEHRDGEDAAVRAEGARALIVMSCVATFDAAAAIASARPPVAKVADACALLSVLPDCSYRFGQFPAGWKLPTVQRLNATMDHLQVITQFSFKAPHGIATVRGCMPARGDGISLSVRKSFATGFDGCAKLFLVPVVH